MEEEPELEARVVEQARVDELRERQRVMLDALRVAARARILRLECVGKRRDRLPVGMLQQATLPAFDLDDPAQVARIDEQLLGVAFAAGDDAFVRRLVEPVDQRQQRQWAERLPQNRPRARPLRFLDRRARSRQHHDRRCVVPAGGELTAEREPVEAGQLHVEQYDGGRQNRATSRASSADATSSISNSPAASVSRSSSRSVGSSSTTRIRRRRPGQRSR